MAWLDVATVQLRTSLLKLNIEKFEPLKCLMIRKTSKTNPGCPGQKSGRFCRFLAGRRHSHCLLNLHVGAQTTRPGALWMGFCGWDESSPSGGPGSLVLPIAGWWWLEPWNFMFHILGISSSQLTNFIIFRRGGPTTNQQLFLHFGAMKCYEAQWRMWVFCTGAYLRVGNWVRLRNASELTTEPINPTLVVVMMWGALKPGGQWSWFKMT
jgi:hypothetical protein